MKIRLRKVKDDGNGCPKCFFHRYTSRHSVYCVRKDGKKFKCIETTKDKQIFYHFEKVKYTSRLQEKINLQRRMIKLLERVVENLNPPFERNLCETCNNFDNKKHYCSHIEMIVSDEFFCGAYTKKGD